MHHSEDKFISHNDVSLYYQSWQPSGTPKAVLVVIHGLAEHCGRYSNLVNYLVPGGYAIFSFDLCGHGKSEGSRCYIERFSHYFDELDTLIDIVRSKYKDTKLFLLGHSMGGTIATAYALEHQNSLAGLVLSGAALQVNPHFSPALITMARVLSTLRPRTGIATLDADLLSRDKAVVKAYVADSLVYRGKISARLGVELLNTIQDLPKHMPEIKLPALIMHGTADRMSMPAGSQVLYERIGSKDKTLKLYDGFYHEIFNEPGHERVLSDLRNWLDNRCEVGLSKMPKLQTMK